MTQKLLATWIGIMIVTSAFVMTISAEENVESRDIVPVSAPVTEDTVWAPDLTGPRDENDMNLTFKDEVASNLSPISTWDDDETNSLLSSGNGVGNAQMAARPGEMQALNPEASVTGQSGGTSARQTDYQNSYTAGGNDNPIIFSDMGNENNAYVNSILLVHADDGDGEPLRSELDAYPDIGTVDVFDARSATPDLTTLLAYDVVFTWSNYAYADQTALGNVLADYVDNGGRIVQTTFDWIDTTWGLGGRLVDEGYSPLMTMESGNHYAWADLGWYDNTHPIMAGVTAAGDVYRDYTALAPGATLLASWDDGENYVAIKGNVVAINSYLGTYRIATGDGPLICHNAATFINAQQTPWFDDMEGGTSPWTSDGMWHQVWDSVSPYPEYYSYESSWWYGQDATGTYNNGAQNWGRLETPQIQLEGTGATLVFWEWYETEGAYTEYDQRWIQVDDGSGWQNVELLDEISMSTWEERIVDLSAYDGQTVSIGFFFDTVDGDVNDYRGWYVDDVLVASTYNLDLQPEFQRGFGQPGDSASYLLTVTNDGMSDDTYDLSAGSVWPVDFYDLGTPSSSQMNNPSFETGDFTDWNTVDLAMPFSPLQVSGAGNDPWGFFLSAPTDGIFSLQTGFDGDGPGNILAGQDFDVPLGASTLMFDYRAGWDLQMIPATIDRTFSVLIEPSGGGPPIKSDLILTAPAGTLMGDTGILQGFVDLSPFAGTTVYIEFDWWVPETMSGPAFFELDNIRVAEPASTSQIGPVISGESMNFMAVVGIPGGATPGDFDVADIQATSQGDPLLWEIVQTETVVPFSTDWSDGFESGWGAWTFEEFAQGGIPTYWEIGNPSGSGPGSAFGGTECAGTNLWDWYYPDAEIALLSPWVELGTGPQVLSFQTWYDMETWGDDGGFVEINAGGGWTQIWPSYGSPNMDYPYPDAYCGGQFTDAFSGTSDGWEFYEFDLSAYSGRAVQARFHFDASPWWGGQWGWYLDDMFMGAPPQYRVDLLPASQTNFGFAGTDTDHYLSASNSGSETDTYDLSSVNVWPVEFWSTPYQSLVTEDFDGPFPPNDWVVNDWNDWGDPLGCWHRSDYTGYGNFAGSGYCAEANSDAMSNWWTGGGGVDTSLFTPNFSLNGYAGATLEFDMSYYDINWGADDYAEIYIYYDGSADLLQYYDEDHSSFGPGEHVAVDLSSYVGYSDVYIEFYYYDAWTWAGWWQIDNVLIYGDTGLPSAPITSVGPLESGRTLDFIARVGIPGGALPGESDIATATATSQNDPMATSSAQMMTFVPGGILLVDDDGGLSVENYHVDALNDIGMPFIYWETDSLGCPDSAFMSMFDAIVWTTGDNSGGTATVGAAEDTLDAVERGELGLFLDNGGRFYLSSGGFGWDSAFNFGTGWMNNYLGANPWNGGSGLPYDLIGIPGDPIGDGLDLQIHAGDYWPELSGVWTWNDPAMPNAAPPLLWDPDMTGAAMRLPTSTYRTVFTGFDLADVDGQANRALLMQRILDWLLAEDEVEVTPEHQEFAYVPDTTIYYLVEMTNRMALPDTFDLSIYNSPIWNTRIMDETASVDITETSYLNYGESFWFTIAVDIPLGALPSEWDIATVMVSSQTNPLVYALTETFTQVWLDPYVIDDFEGSFTDFREYGQGATLWEIGNPSSFVDGPNANSPTDCWGTNLLDYYYQDADCTLVSHYYNIDMASWSEMSFYNWYDIEGMDGGFVEITTDYGQTWTQITPAGGYDSMNWWGFDSFSGDSGGWVQEYFDLSPYIGNTVALRMRFMSSPMATGTFAGWYIDDFSVDATYPQRGCLLTPVQSQGYAYPGNSIDYTLTLKNIGTLGIDTFDLSHSTQTTWSVSYLDTGYNPISFIGPLDYGESQDFIVRVAVPGGANPGDSERTWMYATSQADPMGTDMASLYSQVYADILLVDDDLGIDSEDWYTDSLDWLDSMAYASYNYWDVAEYGVPTLADMLYYDGIIWATGNSYGVNGPSLTEEDRNNIQQYLVANGNVYLTGDMFWMDAWNNDWTDWLGQWFGAVPVDASMGAMGYGWDMFSSSPQNLVGENGDPIGDGLGFPMDAPGSCPSIWGSYATLEIVDPQAERSCYFTPGLAAGATTVVRMDGGNFRTVISSFDHSKMGDMPERTSAMAEILSWLVTRDPVSSGALVDGNPSVSVLPGAVVTLTAVVDTIPLYWWNTVGGAVYTVGEGNFPGVIMDPSDGAFDDPGEYVFQTIDTTGWPDGQHDLYVYGWDSITNYETVSTAFASIIVDSSAPTSNVIQEGSYWRSANPDIIRANVKDFNLVSADFESGAWPPSGWTADGICSASQSGAPPLTHYWSLYDDSVIAPWLGATVARTPPYCAGVWWSDGTGGDPPAGEQDEWLMTPEMDFSSYTTVELEFWSVYTMMRYGADATSHDYIRVSTDGGATWDVVADLAHDPAYDFDGCIGGPAGSDWNWYDVPINIDLSAYAGETSVLIAWHYLAETPTGMRGIWMVDDVQVLGDGIAEISSGVASVELHFRYSADNAIFGPWELYDTLFGEPWDFSFNWPYGEGYYEFYTIAEDNVGNAEAAPFFADAAYAYETSIPWSNAIQTSPYVNYGPSRIIQAVAGNGLSGVGDVELWYRTSKDNSTWEFWTLYSTDTTQPWQWTFTMVADGYYEFYTRAHDRAGNYEDAPIIADAVLSFDVFPPESNAVQDPQYAWNTGPLTVDAVGFDTVTMLYEDFNGAFPPSGWIVNTYDGHGWESSDWWGDGNYATGEANPCADVNSDIWFGSIESEMVTREFSLAGLPPGATVLLEFDMNFQCFMGDDEGYIFLSPDGGMSWDQLLYMNENHGSLYSPPGEHVVLDISAYAGATNVLISFYYYAPGWDWYWQVDNVIVWTVIDPLYVDLYYRHSADNASWGIWTYFDTDMAYPWQFSFNWPDGDGYYELYTVATDEWGWEEAVPATADAAYQYDASNPTVVWTMPPDGAINVPITAGTFSIHFSEPMDTGLGLVFTSLPGTVWIWSADGTWLNGTYGGLAYTTAYNVNLETGGFADLAGNPLVGDGNFTFTTAGAEYASATGPSSTGSQDPRPTITYTYGGAIAAVDIYYSNDGGTSWTFWDQDITPDFSWTPTTDLPSEGTYYWCAQANGFEPVPTNPTFIEAGPYVYDITPPASSVDPISPYWHNAPITLTATAFDGLSGVAWVEFFYSYSADNFTWNPTASLGSDFTFPYTRVFSWPAGDGYYLFYSAAVDVASNLEAPPGVWDAMAAYDSTDPVASVDSLGQYWYTASPLTLTATAADGLNPVDHVELVYWFSANGVTWGGPTIFAVDASAPWSWDFTYPNGTGYYRFAARAHDTLGNAPAWPPATYDVEVGYDNLNPSSAAIYMPPYEQTSTTLIIQATASDSGPSGLYYVSLYYRFSPDNGTTPWTPWGGFATDYSPPYQFTFTFPDGVGYYQFYSVATDNAYNEENSPPMADATWWWNPPAPVSNVNQYSPYWLDSPVTLTASVTATGNAVDYVELWYSWSVNNITWGAWQVFGTDMAAPWEWNFDFLPSGEGYYMFFSRAMDVLGNYETPPATADAYNAYDTTDPSSSVTFAAPYWRNTSPITIDATASDALSGVASVQLYFRYSADNVTFNAWAATGAPDTTSPYSFSFAFASGQGYYEFYTRATDTAGNVEAAPATADVRYGYDNVPPSSNCDVTGAFWRNTTPITITATATSTLSPIASVQLYFRYSADNVTFNAWAATGAPDTTSPYSFSFAFASGQGYYQFYTRATDTVGNVETAPATADVGYGYDTTLPTSVCTVTGAYWRNTSPITIDATASDALSGVASVQLYFRYSADNVTFNAWAATGAPDTTSPYSFSFAFASGVGYYEFYTRATDRATNVEAAPATADVRYGYDSTAPSSSATFVAPYWRTTSPLAATATATDSLNSVANVELWYRFSADNATWGAWTNFGTDNAAPWGWSFTFPSGEGFYEFYTRATDSVGNYEAAPAGADAGWAYDVTAPASTAAVPGAYASYDISRTVDATATDAGGLANVTLYFRWSADNTTWDGWVAFSTDDVAPWSWLFTMPNGTGYYEFYTVATDLAGNTELPPASADCSCRRRADTSPPTSSVTLTGPYWQIASPMTIDATANDAESGVASVELWYRFSTDNSTWGSWTSAGTDTVAPYQWSFAFPSGQGYYQFYTIAADLTGNTESAPGSADASWAYDITPPNVVVTALPAYVTTATFNIAFTAADAGGVAYSVLYYTTDGGTTWTALATHFIASPIAFTATAEGYWGFYIVAYDLAGNHRVIPSSVTAPDTSTIVDTTAPTATGAPSGANITIATNITVTFSEPVNQANAEAAFSISPTIAGTFMWNTAGTVMTFVPGSALGYGTEYTVTLDATGIADAAGNLMSADNVWTFTTSAQPQAPTGSITGRVVDEGGNGISGATVSIQGTTLTTTTDANGNYAFGAVPAGSYTIVASMEGYESGSTAATASAGAATTADDITLTREDEIGPGGNMTWIIIILLLAIVVGGLLMFILFRKKKKEPSEPDDGQEQDDEESEPQSEGGKPPQPEELPSEQPPTN